jgi:hypothetical protein
MSYIPRETSSRRRPNLHAVEPPRAIAHDAHFGLPERLFTTLTAGVFVLLMAAVAAALLYTQAG